MKLPKKKARIVLQAVETLEQEQVLDPVTAARIRENVVPLAFDWRRLARYSFAIALVCIVIAVGAALADEWLMALLERLFRMPWAVKSLACAVLSAAIILLGLQRRRLHPGKIYSNEAVFFAGVLGIAGSIACLGKAIDTGSGHYSLLILLAALVYGFLGLALGSKLIWVFSLLSIGGWFGAETGYASGWGAYYLGMAYPLRFVLFGGALTLAALALRRHARTAAFFGTTRVAGLLYLFIALWILSIWGNYDGYDSWHRSTHAELFQWSVYFALAALACLYFGLKHDDGVLRGFGLTFLGLNLYTRFFEYFWDGLHKAVFFALLAASFWLIGSRAETLWQMNRLKARLRD
jgi:hypothetical protein